MKVGAAARAAGVSVQVMQTWLMLGLIRESARTSGGHRLFDQDAVRRVKLIRRLNQSGYPLRDIREIFLEGHGSSGVPGPRADR